MKSKVEDLIDLMEHELPWREHHEKELQLQKSVADQMVLDNLRWVRSTVLEIGTDDAFEQLLKNTEYNQKLQAKIMNSIELENSLNRGTTDISVERSDEYWWRSDISQILTDK